MSEIEIEKSGPEGARRANRCSRGGRAFGSDPRRAASAAGPAAAPALTRRSIPGVVKSPMVGTAYRSPEPGAAPFIEVGAQRNAGRHVADHRSDEDHEPDSRPKAGMVTAILFENGQPVEFGEPLVIIE